MKPTMLLPVGSLLEFAGVLTLITNEGTLTPAIDIGITFPALISPDIQGIGLLVAGGAIIAYSVTRMN